MPLRNRTVSAFKNKVFDFRSHPSNQCVRSVNLKECEITVELVVAKAAQV